MFIIYSVIYHLLINPSILQAVLSKLYTNTCIHKEVMVDIVSFTQQTIEKFTICQVLVQPSSQATSTVAANLFTVKSWLLHCSASIGTTLVINTLLKQSPQVVSIVASLHATIGITLNFGRTLTFFNFFNCFILANTLNGSL